MLFRRANVPKSCGNVVLFPFPFAIKRFRNRDHRCSRNTLGRKPTSTRFTLTIYKQTSQRTFKLIFSKSPTRIFLCRLLECVVPLICCVFVYKHTYRILSICGLIGNLAVQSSHTLAHPQLRQTLIPSLLPF